MTELVIERNFDAPPEMVFDFVTNPKKIALWWGPETMTCPQLDMNFRKKGPWSSTMRSQEGNEFHVSGEVIDVDPPKSLRFTWAWHDDAGVRGHESEVAYDIRENGQGGTLFKLIHTGLSDEESADNHSIGWSSSLRKLTHHLSST